MKLNTEIKNKVLSYLTDKAFPYTKEKELKDAVVEELMKTPEVKNRIEILSKAPDYICSSTRVNIKTDDLSIRRRYTYLDFTIPKSYAVKVKEFGSLDLQLNELEKVSPELSKRVKEYCKFINTKNEYVEKIKSILSIVQSSTPLIELIPECEEFFQTIKGVISGSALIDKASVDFINNCLKGATE